MAKCDIIIPFYQRDAGILLRAVRSILAQTYTDFRIIIVDDGSPFPAEKDLQSLSADERKKVELIKQKNGGVSVARNSGLAAVSDDAQAVAFLDSDDEWLPHHLECAMRAIESGVDYYWATISADEEFDTDGTPSKVIKPELLQPSALGDGFYEIEKFYEVLACQWWRIMHLSVTVISAPLARQVRFKPRIKIGEDFALYIDCTRLAKRACVSDRPAAARGVGDNLWHNVGWGELKYSQEKVYSHQLLKELLRDERLQGHSRLIVSRRKEVSREMFIWNEVHRLLRGRGLAVWSWMVWLGKDPGILLKLFTMKFGKDPNRLKTEIPGEEQV